jgi:hypothetical protein
MVLSPGGFASLPFSDLCAELVDLLNRPGELFGHARRMSATLCGSEFGRTPDLRRQNGGHRSTHTFTETVRQNWIRAITRRERHDLIPIEDLPPAIVTTDGDVSTIEAGDFADDVVLKGTKNVILHAIVDREVGIGTHRRVPRFH